MTKNKICISLTLASLALLAASPAQADNTAVTTAPAAAAAPAAPTLMPAMAGPLGMDTTPYSFNAGPLNKIYVSGVASVTGMAQSHHVSGDKTFRGNLSNGQIFIQNTDGPAQFFIQAGAYSLPALGTSYLRANKTTGDTYGYLPQGYLKWAPNSNLSVMAGKLPTLIGDEYTFTFENMNIERGLLWNQENAVNRGIQGNYTMGPLALSLSWNDGFYSGHYSWLTGLATYTLGSNDSVAVDAGGNLSHTARNTYATPKAQDNGSIYNIMYTHTDGAWTFNPYLQYTYIPQSTDAGSTKTANTYGAAFLTKYSFDQNFSLAGRLEYIKSSGTTTDGAPNLLYGQGSRAWSMTLTPTYQMNMFFGRAEASYTRAMRAAAGDAFGVSGNEKAQARLMLETGITF